jgi:hypothetical protein
VVPRNLLLREGRHAGGELAYREGLLRGGIHPNIVLLRAPPKQEINHGETNRKLPNEVAAAAAALVTELRT